MSAVPLAEDAVQLLWTAGWDSTYRLLELVIHHQRAVVPHYIVSPDRPGTMQELNAMRAIRQRVEKDFPGRASLIAATRITLLDSIAPRPEVTEKLQRLKSCGHLGSQYDWLARYALEQGIQALELCIHADDRAEAFLREALERVELPDGGGYWQLKRGETGDLSLFAGFRFPILTLTKPEMRRNAEAAGFGGIMALTWFCHTPINGRPCGVCNPCRYTIAEGLADRLPRRALLRHRIAPHLERVRTLVAPLRIAVGGMVHRLTRRRSGMKRS